MLEVSVARDRALPPMVCSCSSSATSQSSLKSSLSSSSYPLLVEATSDVFEEEEEVDYMMHQKFLDRWLNENFGPKNTSTAERPVVIALGDAGFSSCSKHHAPSPNKKMADMLAKRYCGGEGGRVYDQPSVFLLSQ